MTTQTHLYSSTLVWHIHRSQYVQLQYVRVHVRSSGAAALEKGGHLSQSGRHTRSQNIRTCIYTGINILIMTYFEMSTPLVRQTAWYYGYGHSYCQCWCIHCKNYLQPLLKVITHTCIYMHTCMSEIIQRKTNFIILVLLSLTCWLGGALDPGDNTWPWTSK